MDEVRIIRREVKRLEEKAKLVETLRVYGKTSGGGRLSPFGRAMLVAARAHGVKQADMAKLLGITAGAVSQHYNN